SSLRILGDRRPFEERLKQRGGRKKQASHVICQPSTYNMGNLAKEGREYTLYVEEPRITCTNEELGREPTYN
ncbi:hypothetical protein PIB30_106694, partial [Stylosanthes scabra]|nr:hypothetical protein [Stylosanthes scabra]